MKWAESEFGLQASVSGVAGPDRAVVPSGLAGTGRGPVSTQVATPRVLVSVVHRRVCPAAERTAGCGQCRGEREYVARAGWVRAVSAVGSGRGSR
jgi:hypothetical protein